MLYSGDRLDQILVLLRGGIRREIVILCSYKFRDLGRLPKYLMISRISANLMIEKLIPLCTACHGARWIGNQIVAATPEAEAPAWQHHELVLSPAGDQGPCAHPTTGTYQYWRIPVHAGIGMIIQALGWHYEISNELYAQKGAKFHRPRPDAHLEHRF